MPDVTPDGTVPTVTDPLALPQFRVSGYYADDVQPPRVAGELAAQTPAYDELDRDEVIGQFADRSDLARILVEQRVASDFNANTTNSTWKAVSTWTRNDDGHGWSHS